MQIIIDRIEEDKAVIELENGKIITVFKELFKDAKEGDVFDIIKNENETENKNNNIKTLMDKLFE